MVDLASPVVHSNLEAVEYAAAVDLLEPGVHLLAVELGPVGSPLTDLDGRISKIGYDLMNRCKEKTFLFIYLEITCLRVFFIKNFKIVSSKSFSVTCFVMVYRLFWLLVALRQVRPSN